MLQGFFNSGRRAGVLIAALFIILNALFATALMGQMFLGSVVGQITDTSGAVVPGAKVVLTNTQTLVQRETVATSAGDYTFDNVPTGTYKVAVTMSGFEQAVSTEIIVGTGATLRFDATLTTGKVTQRVEVTAQAPTLNTENAEIGSVVTRTEIADLPMSKSPMDFRYLDSSNQQGGYLSGMQQLRFLLGGWRQRHGPGLGRMERPATFDVYGLDSRHHGGFRNAFSRVRRRCTCRNLHPVRHQRLSWRLVLGH